MGPGRGGDQGQSPDWRRFAPGWDSPAVLARPAVSSRVGVLTGRDSMMSVYVVGPSVLELVSRF